MTEPVHTTISAAHRTITQLLANGRTVRYSLSPTSDGDVYWRQDTFAAADDLVRPLQWIGHQGPLGVAAVIEAVPICRETVRAWTRAEIDDAFAGADLDDVARQRRAAALTRLRAQLADSLSEGASAA